MRVDMRIDMRIDMSINMRINMRAVVRRACATAPFESSRQGGQERGRHVYTGALDIPSAMADRHTYRRNISIEDALELVGRIVVRRARKQLPVSIHVCIDLRKDVGIHMYNSLCISI